MLVLRRRHGEWTEIIHRSGDKLRIKVELSRDSRERDVVKATFEDEARNFEIHRPESRYRKPSEPPP